MLKSSLKSTALSGWVALFVHQCVEEHKRVVIGNHAREQHGNEPYEIAKNFRVLRKCSNKFDCLIFETFLFGTLTETKLNKQSEFIHQSCLPDTLIFFILFTSYLNFIFKTSYLSLFVFKYLAFYFLFHCFRNCISAEFFIHELENDGGAIEMSFLFLNAGFYNKKPR